MTDMELLKLAAKANGHEIEFDELSGLVFLDNKYTCLTWNSLDNDRDAFDLQCNLLITTSFECAIGGPLYACADYCQIPVTDDKREAMRRAITMAAAERVED